MIYYYTGAGGAGGNAFVTIQTDFGTNPVADNPADVLTFTSSDGSIIITGNAALDEVDLVWNPVAVPSWSTIIPTAGAIAVADAAGDTLTMLSTDGSTVITGADNPETLDFTTNILSWAQIAPTAGFPLVPATFNDLGLTIISGDASVTVTGVPPNILDIRALGGGGTNSWDTITGTGGVPAIADIPNDSITFSSSDGTMQITGTDNPENMDWTLNPGVVAPLLDHSLLVNLPFDFSGHPDFQRQTEQALVDPTVNNDSVDTAGLGHPCRAGDMWLNTLSDIVWICVDDTPTAAIWVTQSNFSPSQTIYVAENGYVTGDGTKENPFPTVDQALVAAAALVPATNNRIDIIVSAGEYTINNNLAAAILPQYTTLFAEANDIVVISGTNMLNAIISIGGNYTTIQGVWFNCPTSNFAIESISRSVTHIKNCSFNNGMGALHFLGGGSVGSKIKDCQFYNQSLTAYLGSSADRVKLESSMFTNMVASAIVISGGHWLKATDLFLDTINSYSISASDARIDVDTFWIFNNVVTAVTLVNSTGYFSNVMVENGVNIFVCADSAYLRLHDGYISGTYTTATPSIIFDTNSHGDISNFDLDIALLQIGLIDTLSTCQVSDCRIDLKRCVTQAGFEHNLKGTWYNVDGEYNPALDPIDYERKHVRRDFEVGFSEHGKLSFHGEGGYSARGDLVYTFNGAAYVGVSNLVEYRDGFTTQFPNLIPGTAIYISSSLIDTNTFLPKQFFGFRAVLNQLFAGTLDIQYWNGGWNPVNWMVTGTRPPYGSYANNQFSSCPLDCQVRLDENMATDWITNDPPGTGVPRYWIRIIITAPSIQTMIINQIQIHTNAKGMAREGYVEHFGKARDRDYIDISLADMPTAYEYEDGALPAVPAIIGPSQWLMTSKCWALPYNEQSTIYRFCGICAPNPWVDTSCKMEIEFKFFGDMMPGVGVTDQLLFEFHYALVRDYVNNVFPFGAGAPALAPNEIGMVMPFTVPVGAINKEMQIRFVINVPQAAFNAIGSVGYRDKLFVGLQRITGIAQEYPGTIYVEEAKIIAYRWCNGEK